MIYGLGCQEFLRVRYPVVAFMTSEHLSPSAAGWLRSSLSINLWDHTECALFREAISLYFSSVMTIYSLKIISEDIREQDSPIILRYSR